MRKEPSLGNLFGLIDKVPRLDHEKLVVDALDTFTKAEQQMTNAVAQIEGEISARAEEIAEAQRQMDAARGSRDRLNRVIGKLKALVE